jgi:hypothetical protein
MELLLGIVIGAAGAWFYRSRMGGEAGGGGMAMGGQDMRRSLADAARSGADRAASLIDTTPLPRTVKDRATSAVRTGADRLQNVAGSAPQEQPLAKMVDAPQPEDVRAEEDAARRAAADAQREQQTGL